MGLGCETMRWQSAAKATWVAAMLGLWALRLGLFLMATVTSQSDFATYVAAAMALRMNPHANIYAVAVIAPYSCGLLPASHAPYIYPPLLAILLIPFTFLTCHTALVVWEWINLALWLVLLVLLLRYLPRHRVLLLPLGLFFIPLWSAFFYGQINEIIVLGVLVALWFIERQHPRAGGVVLGVLTAIKLFPALLIVYFIVRRQWQVGIAAGLTLVASGLAMVAVVGVSGMRTASGAILGFHSITDHFAFNIALFPVSPVFPPLLVGLALLFLAAVWRYQDADMRLGYAWGLCTMTLVLPLIWEHYFVWLLPVYVYILSRWPERRVVLPLVPIFVVMAAPILFNPLLTALTLVPLWGVSAWVFLASSLKAAKDIAWARHRLASGVRTIRVARQVPEP